MANQSLTDLTQVTAPDLATLLYVSEAGVSKSESISQLHQGIVNTIAGTTHLFAIATDAAPAVTYFTSSSDSVGTVPTNANAAFPIGTVLTAIAGDRKSVV